MTGNSLIIWWGSLASKGVQTDDLSLRFVSFEILSLSLTVERLTLIAFCLALKRGEFKSHCFTALSFDFFWTFKRFLKISLGIFRLLFFCFCLSLSNNAQGLWLDSLAAWILGHTLWASLAPIRFRLLPISLRFHRILIRRLCLSKKLHHHFWRWPNF